MTQEDQCLHAGTIMYTDVVVACSYYILSLLYQCIVMALEFKDSKESASWSYSCHVLQP